MLHDNTKDILEILRFFILDNTNTKTSDIFSVVIYSYNTYTLVVILLRSIVDFTFKPKSVLVLNFKKKRKAFTATTAAAGAVVCSQKDYVQLTLRFVFCPA